MRARLWAVTWAALVVSACETPPRLDLQDNENLYKPTGYKARHATGKAVYVAPVVDARVAPTVGPLESVGYMDDGDWDRSPLEMVRSVLVDELRASGLFTAVLDAPAPEAFEIVPTLKSFDGGLQEQPFGRRSMSKVELTLAVRSPEQDGARGQVLDEAFGAQQVSNVAFRPPSPRVLLGTGLRTALAKGMAALDSAAAAPAAEASAPRR